MGQPESPILIQRQQVLAHKFIRRPGLRTVVVQVKLNVLAVAVDVVRFSFKKNLSDMRRNGVNRRRHGENSCRRETGICQPRMNAIADGPDVFFARQIGK